MVAVLVDWHEHHVAAARAVSLRLEAGEAMVLAAPALVETYAVLTRLPAPHRLAPADAQALLEANFGGHPVATLDGGTYRSLVREAPGLSLSGGRIYDAVIARCAVRAAVETLLTFNERHFRGLESELEIIVPSA